MIRSTNSGGKAVCRAGLELWRQFVDQALPADMVTAGLKLKPLRAVKKRTWRPPLDARRPRYGRRVGE
jgi:hypothetical protein